MTTPKLSLSRMEEYCASIDALETAAGYYAGSPPALLRDDARILLSWAKRARGGLVEFEAMRKTLDDIIHEFIGVPIAQQDEAWKEKLCDLVVKADERFFATDSIRADLLLSECRE